MSFAQNPDLCIGELQIFELEIESFLGAESVQPHQSHEGEVPKGAKAAPELGDLFGAERHNHPPWLPEPETGGEDTMGSSVTKRRSPEIEVREVARPCGQRMSGMEAI